MATGYNGTLITNMPYSVNVQFDWQVKSQTGMRSTIAWTVSLKNPNRYGIDGSDAILEVTINDDRVLHRAYPNVSGATSTTIATGEYVVTRDNDTNIGALEVTISPGGTLRKADGTTLWEILSGSAYDATELFQVHTTTTFGNGAQLLSAPDFTDEDNPTITFAYDKGTEVTSAIVEAAISFTGATDDIPYREVSLVTGSYTFELTGSERAKLWELLDNGTTATVRFYLRTAETVGAETQYIYNYLTKTLTFVNYKPVLTPLVEDINSDTLRLTGDKYTMVRYFSTAYFDTQAVARKGATIANQEVRNGDKTVSSVESTGQISNIPSNTFYFSITDNRGYTTNDAVIFNNLSDLKFIDYVKLSCNIKNQPLGADGNLTVNVSGKYFEGSFGKASNKLTLEYKIQKSGSNLGIWMPVGDSNGIVTPSVDDEHNYSYSFTIPDLDYKETYELSVRASDELMPDYAESKLIVSAQPIFDWGKEDFRFYVPVQMDGGYQYPQTVLWSLPTGTAQTDEVIAQALLGEGTTITLDHPVSEQPTGIVLVFSLYRDTVVQNASFHTFFVSKAEVKYLQEGKPHMFMMGINSNLSIFGSKYVYISDGYLSGFEGNVNSGTAACGIKFNNDKFILRYVIGV